MKEHFTPEVEEKARILIAYIRSLRDFVMEDTCDANYGHMGATIVDAMLQAGLTYETTVAPRVGELKRDFPEAATTTGLIKLFENVGGVGVLTRWRDPEKPARIEAVARFLLSEGIETEDALREWLERDGNVKRLKRLRGIGDKTADYFKILVGLPTTAVDRHIMDFLEMAGAPGADYNEAQRIVHCAADLMGVDRALLDHSIWTYMSRRRCGGRRR